MTVKEKVTDEIQNGIRYINSNISKAGMNKKYYMQGRLNSYEEIMNLFDKGLTVIEVAETILDRAEKKKYKFDSVNNPETKIKLYGEIKAYIFTINLISGFHENDFEEPNFDP